MRYLSVRSLCKHVGKTVEKKGHPLGLQRKDKIEELLTFLVGE